MRVCVNARILLVHGAVLAIGSFAISQSTYDLIYAFRIDCQQFPPSKLQSYENPDVFISCPSADHVERITFDEMCLLLGVPSPSDRLRILR